MKAKIMCTHGMMSDTASPDNHKCAGSVSTTISSLLSGEAINNQERLEHSVNSILFFSPQHVGIITLKTFILYLVLFCDWQLEEKPYWTRTT
jgi:hypothetical protein